jgi:hypothetical protein
LKCITFAIENRDLEPLNGTYTITFRVTDDNEANESQLYTLPIKVLSIDEDYSPIMGFLLNFFIPEEIHETVNNTVETLIPLP